MRSPLPAAAILHYRLAERLGCGGDAERYRAIDVRDGGEVELELLPLAASPEPEPGTPGEPARWLGAARAAEALGLSGIVPLYDLGAWQGRTFVVTPRVAGRSFAELAGSVAPREALRLVCEVAELLAHAHAHGVVHGALSADRLVRGPDARARIVGFGLGPLLDAAPAVRASGAYGEVAPELVGGGASDVGSEVYALGAVLRALLARGPAGRATRATEALCRSALATDPGLRFADMAAFARALRAARHPWRPLGRQLLAAGAVLALAMLALLLLRSCGAQSPAGAEPPPETSAPPTP
ncbi:MAG: hypothetical protein IT373_07885 [Polyangiaceae bacterium]|nr:hypothetical protein [Polyangiaceae bacterium]